MTDLRDPDFSKLLTIEQYVDLVHSVPYTYTLTKDTHSLSVFGADHSNDPSHPQFGVLQKLLEQTSPHCVLLEGIQDEITFSHLHELISAMDATTAIGRGGEAVFAAYLALEQGITWQTVEPTDTELFSYIESLGFERREIVVWALLRLLPQYIRRDEMVATHEYLEPFLEQIARATGWSEAHEPIEAVLVQATEIIGADLVTTSEIQAIAYTSPLAVMTRDRDYTVLNTIATVANEYRDRAMIQNTVTALKQFGNVLVVYGASHAVTEELVFRHIFGE